MEKIFKFLLITTIFCTSNVQKNKTTLLPVISNVEGKKAYTLEHNSIHPLDNETMQFHIDDKSFDLQKQFVEQLTSPIGAIDQKKSGLLIDYVSHNTKYSGRDQQGNYLEIIFTTNGLRGSMTIDDNITTLDYDYKQNIVYTYDVDETFEESRCGNNDIHNQINTMSDRISSTRSPYTGCVQIDLALAVDHEMYDHYDNDPQNVIDETAILVNSLNTIDFLGYFTNTIHLNISEIVISTCDTCDPWSNGPNAFILYNDFEEWKVNGGFSSEYDLGLLITDQVLDGGIAGVAYTGGICEGLPHNTAIVKNNNNANTHRVIIAHEIGHGLGANHNNMQDDDDCNPPPRDRLIMDRVVHPTAVGWSTGNEICAINNVDSINYTLTLGCLDICVEDSCDILEGLLIIPSTDSITVTWNPSVDSIYLTVTDPCDDSVIFEGSTTDSFYVFKDQIDINIANKLNIASVCIEGPSDILSVIIGGEVDCEPEPEFSDVTISATLIPGIANGPTAGALIVDVLEVAGTETSGQITVVLFKDNRYGLTWDQNASNIGPLDVQNASWCFESTGPVHVFKTNPGVTIAPGEGLSFGVTTTYDPEATSGTVTYTITIVTGSGGEENGTNNIDAETLIYFSN